MALFGVGGALGIVILVIAIVVGMMLALSPLAIAHALYQIGGALRLKVKAEHAQLPATAFLDARKTPLPTLAIWIAFAMALVGIAVFLVASL